VAPLVADSRCGPAVDLDALLLTLLEDIVTGVRRKELPPDQAFCVVLTWVTWPCPASWCRFATATVLIISEVAASGTVPSAPSAPSSAFRLAMEAHTCGAVGLDSVGVAQVHALWTR